PSLAQPAALASSMPTGLSCSLAEVPSRATRPSAAPTTPVPAETAMSALHPAGVWSMSGKPRSPTARSRTTRPPGATATRGDLTSFQFAATAMGGAIFTFAGNTSGGPVSLTLSNVTLRRNQAVGGDDNTAGTFMNAGVGGGLVNIATNDFVTPSGGSTTTL